MEITQEKVVALLIEGNGKVKNSDLLGWFKGCFDSSDPVEKKQNRDLFKRIVNNIAVVKEIDDVKYVVLKTKYHHLLTESQHGGPLEQREHDEARQPGEHTPARRERTEKHGDEGGGVGSHSSVSQQPLATSHVSAADPEENKLHSARDSAASVIELALKRTNFSDLKLKKNFHCEIGQGSKPNVPKAYGLPLRMPPTDTRSETHRPGRISDVPGVEGSPSPPGTPKGRPLKTPKSHSSPLPGRAPKTTKPSAQVEEPVRDPRFSSAVPLEAAEHEWLLLSAAGRWGQVYGLLLRDNQLVEKRDFMSGFTALHWAAKAGNSDMLCKMIRVARQGGADVDVNARAHGGYTPLHIAALHDQDYVATMLVCEFGADTRLRDNGGKRAYQYLHRGIAGRVRRLLGEPGGPERPPGAEEQELPPPPPPEREDADLFQDLSKDLSKGLHTIGRLFQPHAAGTHRRRHKQRPEIYSLGEEPREESE